MTWIVRGDERHTCRYLPKYGTPILVRRELFNHTLSVAGVALKAAESLGFANRTVIVCTAMPLDIDMLLSEGRHNHGWMQFEELYLSHLSARNQAACMRSSLTASPGLALFSFL